MQTSPMLRRDAGVCGSNHRSLGTCGRQVLSQSRTLGKRSRQSFSAVAAAKWTEKVKEGVTYTLKKSTEAAPVPTPKPKHKAQKPASSPIPKEKTVLLQGDLSFRESIKVEALTALMVLPADDHRQSF